MTAIPHRRVVAAARTDSDDDLLDANEWTWAFVGVDRVDLTENRHVKEFVTLASEDRCRSYCGRTADERIIWPELNGDRAVAG